MSTEVKTFRTVTFSVISEYYSYSYHSCIEIVSKLRYWTFDCWRKSTTATVNVLTDHTSTTNLSQSASNPHGNKRYWTKLLAQFITISTIIASLIGIIGYSYDLYRHGRKKHLIGWFSSAGFVLLTIPISVRLIVNHLIQWNAPNIQKYIVRIVWMIPIYSVESWFALRFKSLALYIETIRECYEAYVIFSFFYFLIALLGDEQIIISKLKYKSPEHGIHPWPLNLLISPWIMGQDLLNKCKIGVLQYVLIKNISALIIFGLESIHVYTEGEFRFDRGYLYICVINNMSQLIALYCLILFYFVTKEELNPYRPVGKFLCVKMVVFFTWWQSLIINLIASVTNVFGNQADNVLTGDWSGPEVSKGLQDYFICIEMFFASIAFTFAFTPKDYISKKNKTNKDDQEIISSSQPFISAFLQSSVPHDMLLEFHRVAGISHNVFSFGTTSASHDAPVEDEEEMNQNNKIPIDIINEYDEEDEEVDHADKLDESNFLISEDTLHVESQDRQKNTMRKVNNYFGSQME